MNQRQFVLLTLAIFLGISNLSFAQETPSGAKIKIALGADLYSRYVWRGMQLGGNSPSIQPSLSVSYKNFGIGAWGAYSISGLNLYQEVDLFLNYSFFNRMFTAVITDYYVPTKKTANFFDYSNSNTEHILEGGLSFNGTEEIPFSFSAYVNFYGADAAHLNNDPSSLTFNHKTGIQYSNYFELAYNTSLNNIGLNLFIGGTLNNPEKANATNSFVGETGFYGNKVGIVNLGVTASKALKITKYYSIPLTTSFIMNPEAKNVFLVFGLLF